MECLLLPASQWSWVGETPIGTPWLLVALALCIVMVFVGGLGYPPTLKKQIQLLDRAELTAGAYKAASDSGVVLGIVLAVLVFAITVFMAVKPALW